MGRGIEGIDYSGAFVIVLKYYAINRNLWYNINVIPSRP